MPPIRPRPIWRHSLSLLLAFCFLNLCNSSRVLGARASTPSATPLSLAPTQNWDGNDGSWSTFGFAIGTPPQLVSLLVATSSAQIWTVATQGCTGGDPLSCPEDRGGLWNYTNSVTYAVNTANTTTDIYTLDLEDQLGYVGKGRYGFDNVQLGWQNGDVQLKNQTVVGIATKDYFMGLFGLDPRESTFVGDSTPAPSVIGALKAKAVIPSLSWAYTAGNQYQSTKFAGSLTLGGYDSSKFTPNSVSFAIADDERDLMTLIQKVTTNSGATNLLPSPVTAYLDSAIPFIYLPPEACTLFEKEFGLTWNETLKLYVVSETDHIALQAKNPSVTFTLGTATQSIDIKLPYAAFDLEASYPFTSDPNTKLRYFPLRRAQSNDQYTLGRTFFQEAYVIADYERRNFSISQCDFNPRAVEKLVAILPVAAPSPKKTPIAAIAGGAAGGALILALVLLYFFWWRPRQKRKRPSELDSSSVYHPLDPNAHQHDPTYIKAELGDGQDYPSGVIRDGRSGKPVELGGQSEIYEMPATEMVHEMANLSPTHEHGRGQLLAGYRSVGDSSLEMNRDRSIGGRSFGDRSIGGTSIGGSLVAERSLGDRSVDVSRHNTTDTLGFPRSPVSSTQAVSGESSIQTTPAVNYAMPFSSPRRKHGSSALGSDYYERRTPSPGDALRGHTPARSTSTADSMGFPMSPESATVSSAGNSLRFPHGSPSPRGGVGSQRESPIISPASPNERDRFRHF